ncbi:hypothetical protein [Hydrogenophaga laconesensis]|uniref:p-aminobenzoate N-oxygenase AurF n=1 Tax=Hydrogenophaga laconesensis TaxID=1805971 RepID=A0ABU1VG98_9BURK|nr:hypothetical protein [Hydrogenophaga laconesensis]MDR7096353.1 hypothetical protein [Hydrogenophaga laconesensis]
MTFTTINTERYAHCIAASRRVRWDIDRDVIRTRRFDFSRPFLPEGLSRVGRLEFLPPAERVRLSQVQGRTYANMFGLVERFIGIQMLSCSRHHWFGDQVALEALVRFTDEELKHQELFRRIERLTAEGMAPGYEFVPTANAVASEVLEASTWAVLALACHIELFTQVHYRESIDPDGGLSELYKDVFLFHWKEESQHAILDELEWERENARLTPKERDAAVDDLIALVGAIDGILHQQAVADAHYFVNTAPNAFTPGEATRIEAGLLDAYRWQYIVSGVHAPRFRQTLFAMTTRDQQQRIQAAIAALVA